MNPTAASQWDQQAPAQLDPTAGPPASRGRNKRGAHQHPPAGRSKVPQGESVGTEWWAVSFVYTRAHLALWWKWVVRRTYYPPPHWAARRSCPLCLWSEEADLFGMV